ncbi:hypothetical protein HanPI659440_Chr01g0023401 [Helianthus annuus]|nr:hypothetical protein HanPI659440_Chr01g0023401 [Helianthus annuus]
MRAGHRRPLGMPNARAETPAQGATSKPKPTRGGDLAFVPNPRPNPRPIPHSLSNTLTYSCISITKPKSPCLQG